MDDMNKKANYVYRKGERIGRYEIVNTLDQARFKDRYLGQQIPLHMPVIIEVFRPPLIDALKQNFLDRAQILMKLKHPHILRLRDAGVRNRYPFLVIDAASYLTLRQVYLPGSIQPLAELLPHLKQIAAALQYAHQQQVLHGDIQPENVLLDGNNNVLLWGFTFEAVMQNLEHLNYQLAGMMPETVAYTAPEQIRGKAEPASDQYSLAILIYELLCGDVPFTGSSIEVAHQQMHALPPSLRQRVPAISAGVERAIMKALAEDPGQRFSDIQTFINTLEQEQIAQFRAAAAQTQPAPAQRIASTCRTGAGEGQPPTATSPGRQHDDEARVCSRVSGSGRSGRRRRLVSPPEEAGETGTSGCWAECHPSGYANDRQQYEGAYLHRTPGKRKRAGVVARRQADRVGQRRYLCPDL